MAIEYRPLGREFFRRDGVTVAKSLLGALLVCRGEKGVAAGRIVETEAYMGTADLASHARSGRPTPRTRVMYGDGGHAYVYFIYGMYNCFNVVANREGIPEAVLIRALEPVAGIGLMKERRGVSRETDLCSGPGKLCAALGIGRAHNGADLCKGELIIAGGKPLEDSRVIACPRINVDYAGEAAFYPYRFVERDSRYLSKRPDVMRFDARR